MVLIYPIFNNTKLYNQKILFIPNTFFPIAPPPPCRPMRVQALSFTQRGILFTLCQRGIFFTLAYEGILFHLDNEGILFTLCQ
jgi:hypothetical protein